MTISIEDKDEYKSFLEELAVTFRTENAKGTPPTMRQVVDLLRTDGDNTLIRNLCVELKIGTKRDFDREMNRARQRDVLGVAPANPTELVAAFVKRHQVTARLDGLFTRVVLPEWVDEVTGEATIVTQADRDRDHVTDLYMSFHCDARTRFNRSDFELELRTLSTNYKMGFQDQGITDAVKTYLQASRRTRLYEIYVGTDNKDVKFDAAKMWTHFAEQVFDYSETSPEFVAAVLRKFVWQVKRKLRGLPVTDHLMPVILGPQGIGKSTLVNMLLQPVAELKLNVDFQMVTDERNMDIWQSYVMFLDEMGYASKADIDTVKNIITATTLTRRPMRTNDRSTIEQNATFIGCSNRELAQLIRDPTGIRRFAGIRMRSDANRALINGMDWSLMWGGVSISEADPMTPFKAMLSDVQEGARERSRVEQWMVDFDGANHRYQAGLNKAGNISSQDLYEAFRDYEDINYPGNYKTSKSDWDLDMARLLKNTPDVVIFEKKRGGSGVMYRWAREMPLRLVD